MRLDEGPKLTVPEVLPFARAYVKKPGNGVGGSLHIVLEDQNLDDANVEFCVKWAEDNDDPDGVSLARMLLRMSGTQRFKIATRCWQSE